MLILTRRTAEFLIIQPEVDIDPAMTVAELFAAGPLGIHVLGVKGNQVRIGISAPQALNIVRD